MTIQRAVEAVLRFVALSLPAPTLPEPAAIPPIEGIRIDVKRGPLNISVTWPIGAVPELAAWMREVLR